MQHFFAGTQRAVHNQFLTSLTHTDLNLRQQQQSAAQHHQDHHHFQRPAHLLQHLSDLTQDRTDIQQTQRRELAVKLRDRAVITVIAETGQPALRLCIQRPRREDEVEIRLQAVPVHFSQAGNSGAELLRIAAEGHRIPEFQSQTSRQPFINRHFIGFWRPVTGDQRIMIRQPCHPGQIQLTVHRFAACVIRLNDVGGNLVVNFGQTNPHNRIEGFRRGVMLMQEIRHLRNLLFGDIEQEVIRAVRRQLLFPAIQ
ncbi:hypothetical protein RAVI111496_08485 [Rahnella victoriana]